MSKSRRKQHVLELKVFDFQCDMYMYYDTVVCTIPYYGEIKAATCAGLGCAGQSRINFHYYGAKVLMATLLLHALSWLHQVLTTLWSILLHLSVLLQTIISNLFKVS